ncbi:nucleoside-binding protein [Pseudoduganella lurida]|uniref:Nucleoside-binding protein n=2 Tax=Pseudoduganella lurida TaxID=1036180 RepID=A0A562R0H8_9BURK|nr:nucleoside-binding protein [Pseudoduganella lurida]
MHRRANQSEVKENFMNHRHLALSAAVLAMFAVVPLQAAEPLKVAFVFFGSVQDGAWTYSHDQGRLEMEKALGSKVKTTHVENVPDGADAERVIRKLAAEGNKLIIGASFGYMNAIEKVARIYPDVTFEHVTGTRRSRNVGTYATRDYEGVYLQGILAARMTKSGVIGFVAPFPIPAVLANINAFTLGAQSVDPKVRTRVMWVNTWYDPAREKLAAEALISQGADVLANDTASPAVLQAAQEKGKYGFARDADMSRFAPKSHLTATTNQWGKFYTETALAVMSGTWRSGDVRGGLKEGMVRMAPLNGVVPADAAKLFETRKAQMSAGKLNPFRGPIKDQRGNLKVPAGVDMPLQEVLSMNYYVQGVEGAMPK